jgi:hypothetical protein
MYDHLQHWTLVCLVGAQSAAVVGRDAVRSRLRDERGMTTETVIITAILAALAIAVATIITVKVTGKAEDIPVE